MSVGRERSWRPERSLPRRRAKKLKLFFALALLVVLTLATAFMLWKPPVAPVRFVVLNPSSASVAFREILPAPGDLAATANVKRFELLMQACQTTEPELIRDTVKLDSLQNLQTLSAGPDERLLVYCPVRARIKASAAGAVLEFGRDEGEKTSWESASLFFSSFFSGQYFPRPRVLVVLLEMQNQESGLRHESFSRDSVLLLEKTVAELKQKELYVVAACSAGQRSWEYVVEKAAAPATPEAPAQITMQRQGTAFAHFICETVVENKANTVEELVDVVKGRVKSYVAEQYNCQQDVVLFNVGNEGSRTGLFAGIKPPQKSDYQALMTPKSSDTSPASSGEAGGAGAGGNAGVEAKTESASTAENSAGSDPKASPRELTRHERIQQLWASLPSAESDAANGFPFDVWQCQSALLQAEQLLLNERNEESDLARERAEQALSALNLKVARLRENTVLSDREAVAGYRTWLGLQVNQSLTGPQLAECDALVEAIKAPESRPDIVPSEKKTAAFQNQLTSAVLRRIRETANVPAAQLEQIQTIRKLLAHPVFADWNGPGKASLPWLTLKQLWESTPETADGWRRVEAIARLIELRRQVLTLATGTETSADGRLLSREVWNQVATGDTSTASLQNVMKLLTAAESWLSLGSIGEVRASVLLQKAEEEFGQLTRRMQNYQSVAKVAGSQRSVVPYLIQYFAIQDENAELTAAVLAELDQSARMALPDDRRKAMLELTARVDHQNASSEVAARLGENLTRLFNELNRRVEIEAGGSSQMTAMDHRRLELMPQSVSFPRRPVPGLKVKYADDRSSADGVRQTGIWLGFWSIRLAESLGATEQQTQELWQHWNELKDALSKELQATPVSAESGAENSVSNSLPPSIEARAKLFASLQNVWARIEEASINGPGEQVVTESEYAPIIQSFLNDRRRFEWEVRSQPVLRPDQLGSVESLISEFTGTLVADGKQPVTMEVAFETQALKSQLWLYAPGFEIRGSSNPAEPLQKAADIAASQSDQRVKVELIRSDSAGVLTSPMEAELLVVSETGQLLERKTFMIVPRLKTEWKLEVRHKGALLELLELGRDRFQLNIPPSLEQAALNLQLNRIRGTASKVRVELFPVDSEGILVARDAVWSQELVLEPGKETLSIPMLPQAAAAPADSGTPAAPGAAPAANAPKRLSMDLSYGFAIRLTSLVPELEAVNAVAETALTQILVKCSSIDAYVALPQVSYNAVSRSLEIRMQRQINDSPLQPEKYPIEVHFSPQLLRVLPELSGHLREDLTPNGEVFRFQFTDGIKQLPPEGGIVAVSVAGVPYAWGWKLTEDEGLVPLGDLAGTELLVTLNHDGIKTINSTNNLLFGEDALTDKAVLSPQVHLFGKSWDGVQPPTLELALESIFPERPEKSLYRVEQVTGRWQQSIRFSPGENGAWNVSAKTTSWGPERGFLLAENAWKSGQYDLKSYLTRRDQNSTVQNQLRFVVDVTEPATPELQIDGRDKEGRVPFDQPLQVRVSGVSDPESGVVSIEAGCNEAKLTKVWPPLPGPPIYRDSVIPIEVSANEFGEFEAGEKEINRPLTVYVKVVNAAGRSTLVKREIRVLRPARMTKESAEPVPFSITLVIGDAVQGTIVARLDNLPPKEGKAGEVIQFRNLMEGQHRISWKEKEQVAGQNINNSRTLQIDKEGKPITIEVKP